MRVVLSLLGGGFSSVSLSGPEAVLLGPQWVEDVGTDSISARSSVEARIALLKGDGPPQTCARTGSRIARGSAPG